ncbi:membrane-spanning 4-domains subfamily A member 4D [Salmo trutta]|uniref:Si:ch211-269k10.5 n=1 Tax=Salmo trutta TaxID=8032 RepID=A0A674CKH7_SALTR|nr:membrane-spanning 4-domains subfamily A member 4D-like [Salmo trutta]XP_029602706.1 membrane-spanning 4-domains subfamily A member 4D-like [Salmo trutta]
MKYTFQSDECMVITIPLGSLRDAQEGQLMPEKFHCVFKDVYKVFLKGQPKALGTAQLIAGVLVLILGLLLVQHSAIVLIYTMPSVLFVAAGMLTYAAGHSPDMCVAKLSFTLNIVSCFWTVAAVVLCTVDVSHGFYGDHQQVFSGIKWMIVVLLVIELVVAMVVIYWESKAVCRQHFNILPMVTLKQDV